MRACRLIVLAAVACSSSSSPPCAQDLSCAGPNQVCNLQTLLCEEHETCAVDAGVGLSRPGHCDDTARPRCADLLVPVSPQQASSGHAYSLLCTTAGATPKGAACTASFISGATQIDGTPALFATGRDSCADGLTCVAPAGGSAGTCMRLCGADSDCDASEICAVYFPVSQSRGAPFDSGLCLSRCSGPFAADCSGTCILNGNEYGCIPAGVARQGGACTSRLSACAPGFACLKLQQGHFLEAQCYWQCDAAHTCPSGSCAAVWSDGVGVCL